MVGGAGGAGRAVVGRLHDHLGEPIHHFGGPAELEASAIRTVFLAKVWVARPLLGAVGELTPRLVAAGVAADFGPDLRLLAASQGYTQHDTLALLLEEMNDLNRLPALRLQSLSRLGE